ncbi:peptidoglycan DD-metalloendopeptidase family protein [Mesorhizobium xinjiangense]|uniref:peptidoglycan DD-metalloendopeptidase family protein n=1 Tax=Mesorhizobium xinjiangense TaxID=2678685 RepID=UPI001F19F716|nr:peptidoglycan DD-metalloendopeptidase family protein [Mesorhizobium xinjiangense]
MGTARSSAIFGPKKPPHTVIIARGDTIRHFTLRPWMLAVAGSLFCALAIAYLSATAYLVLRDDLIGASVARQARLQQAYEDRISALRAQVDRVTSRQLLDQQLMEGKVSELLDRQERLSRRNLKLEPLLHRVDFAGARLPEEAPLPRARPDLQAGNVPSLDRFDLRITGASQLRLTALGDAAPKADRTLMQAERADALFMELGRSLRRIEDRQMARIRSLTQNAYATAETIGEALRSAGLPVADDYGAAGTGGPLIAPEAPMKFDDQVDELDEALSTLDRLKATLEKAPVANPADGMSVSSGFGMRKDPILGRPALHSGIDFRGRSGHPVKAAAGGTVMRAGWAGGYGRLIEIDHGNGLSTRYAHLSALNVEKGAKVEAGTVIGRVGSSGRSTGPHLHYEVRKDGAAVNPLPFLKAGKRIGQVM